MEENIEKPLSLEKIARTTGLSRRQIERLFKRDLNCVPKRYYLEMRLRRARELLLQTAMPIMDITAACGFQSPPHFSKCYRNQYGYPPSAERKIGGPRELAEKVEFAEGNTAGLSGALPAAPPGV
jgi:transcriptional regulator GlxA family with amidase domain